MQNKTVKKGVGKSIPHLRQSIKFEGVVNIPSCRIQCFFFFFTWPSSIDASLISPMFNYGEN